MPGFQTKALVVTPISGDNFRIIPPIVWLFRYVCSNKAEFLFCKRKLLDVLSNVYQADVWSSSVFVVTVIARNRINGISLLFFCDRILRFSKNIPRSLRRFLSNFNVVAIQNSLNGFHNTLNVRNNSKTSCWFPFIRSAGFW